MFKNVVLPLFSVPIGIYKIDKEYDLTDYVETNYDFLEINSEQAKGSYISNKKDILNDHLELKTLIQNYFYHYKNTVFGYQFTEFKMTTSWLSKVTKNSSSQFHKHSNSMFSGVYYFDACESTAPLEFKQNGVISNFCLPVSNHNIYNQDTYTIQPEKNYLIFFPSYIEHRIGFHKADKTRYSIAFNFFPTGELGKGDSYVNLDLK